MNGEHITRFYRMFSKTMKMENLLKDFIECSQKQ